MYFKTVAGVPYPQVQYQNSGHNFQPYNFINIQQAHHLQQQFAAHHLQQQFAIQQAQQQFAIQQAIRPIGGPIGGPIGFGGALHNINLNHPFQGGITNQRVENATQFQTQTTVENISTQLQGQTTVENTSQLQTQLQTLQTRVDNSTTQGQTLQTQTIVENSTTQGQTLQTQTIVENSTTQQTHTTIFENETTRELHLPPLNGSLLNFNQVDIVAYQNNLHKEFSNFQTPNISVTRPSKSQNNIDIEKLLNDIEFGDCEVLDVDFDDCLNELNGTLNSQNLTKEVPTFNFDTLDIKSIDNVEIVDETYQKYIDSGTPIKILNGDKEMVGVIINVQGQDGDLKLNFNYKDGDVSASSSENDDFTTSSENDDLNDLNLNESSSITNKDKVEIFGHVLKNNYKERVNLSEIIDVKNTRGRPSKSLNEYVDKTSSLVRNKMASRRTRRLNNAVKERVGTRYHQLNEHFNTLRKHSKLLDEKIFLLKKILNDTIKK